jgi:molybdenum cofactor biosynthesis enzyme MoaA
VSEPSLLTIELGTRCNNRCAFCPQHYLRVTPFQTRDIATRQVQNRLREGRKRGFSRVAFTGGEPTVRSDLPLMVTTARDLGYTEIGITTNGRMLAAPQVVADLLDAGLNRLSFSLHSASAAQHDRLSGIPRAFDQLQAGIKAISEAARRSHREVLLHSVSLLLPETLDHLSETIACAAAMGATIHILQPFIAARANLHVAQDYMVDPAALAQAVSQAGRTAHALGTRVKPYNVPTCQLPGLVGIELQEYGLTTHKRHQHSAQQEDATGQAQFWQVERCQTCPTPCPGFRVEQLDRGKMVHDILGDLACYRSSTIVLPATDLLPAPHLLHLLTELGSGDRMVRPMLGGYHWASPQELVQCLADAAIEEVVLLLRTSWEDPEGREPDPGNETQLLHLAGLLKKAGLRTRLFVSAADLPDFALPTTQLSSTFDAITVAIPRIWRGVGGNGAVAAFLSIRHQRVVSCVENLGRALPLELATFDSVRILGQDLTLVQERYAALMPVADWSNQLVAHRYSSQAYNFILWGNPFWLF